MAEFFLLFMYCWWSLVTHTNMSAILNRLDIFGALWAVFIALSHPNINVMCTEKHMWPPWAIIALLVIRITRDDLKRSITALIIYMMMFYLGF